MNNTVEIFADFHLRAVGGGMLEGAQIFRSCELTNIQSDEATYLIDTLGIRSIYDIRTKWEIAANPEPHLIGTKMIALSPSSEKRRKDASKRLVAGIIKDYGKPEERMISNYRRYAFDYPLIGTVMRSIAHSNHASLIHCVNGKDRTGVLCATLQRICGLHHDDIMIEYLLTNEINAEKIEREALELSRDMDQYEHQILMSFLEARPAYLEAYFDEIEKNSGSFEAYIKDNLRLDSIERARLMELINLR